MKIYILPVNSDFQPEVKNPYPFHNKNFDLEKEFYSYLLSNESILTQEKDSADFFYLPVFWTNWLVQHNYGKKDIDTLKDYVIRINIDPTRTFTICQYDDGPLVSLSGATVFLGSRKNKTGKDFPIISLPHKVPVLKPRKRYIASFVGRINTHPIRERMQEKLLNYENIYIAPNSKNERFFVKKILASYTSLCPRGYGGTSFRFFESMQLGVVPILIGDIDTRPFKSQIDWKEVSFYIRTVEEINNIINLDKDILLKMGVKAKKTWYDKFYNNSEWCKLLLNELKYEK